MKRSFVSTGNRRDTAGHNHLRQIGVVVRAIPQLAIIVVAHGPEASVMLKKKTVATSGGDRRDTVGYNLLGAVGLDSKAGSAVPNWP